MEMNYNQLLRLRGIDNKCTCPEVQNEILEVMGKMTLCNTLLLFRMLCFME